MNFSPSDLSRHIAQAKQAQGPSPLLPPQLPKDGRLGTPARALGVRALVDGVRDDGCFRARQEAENNWQKISGTICPIRAMDNRSREGSEESHGRIAARRSGAAAAAQQRE